MKTISEWLLSKSAKLEAMEWEKTTARGRIVYTRWLYLWAVVSFPKAFLMHPVGAVLEVRGMISQAK